MTQFGVRELIALVCLTELGDVTRMSSSHKAVRFAGIDIGVPRSDQISRVGKLTRQGWLDSLMSLTAILIARSKPPPARSRS